MLSSFLFSGPINTHDRPLHSSTTPRSIRRVNGKVNPFLNQNDRYPYILKIDY